MLDPFRHSMCNEAFTEAGFAGACRVMKAAGYQGIEIAPFTLADDPATLPPARRNELKQIIAEEELECARLHWLMVAPKGLHVTTPDGALRARSWLHIRHLIDLCADLGPRGVMVFGSPNQRGTTGGAPVQQATRRFVDGLASVAPDAVER